MNFLYERPNDAGRIQNPLYAELNPVTKSQFLEYMKLLINGEVFGVEPPPPPSVEGIDAGENVGARDLVQLIGSAADNAIAIA